MLERWLVEGLLDDPYSEFMVQEDKASNSVGVHVHLTCM